MVKDMRFDSTVEQKATNEAEVTVDGRCSSTEERPRFVGVVRYEFDIRVLQKCDCHCDLSASFRFAVLDEGITEMRIPYISSDLPTYMEDRRTNR